jgi:hypothetical protein
VVALPGGPSSKVWGKMEFRWLGGAPRLVILAQEAAEASRCRRLDFELKRGHRGPYIGQKLGLVVHIKVSILSNAGFERVSLRFGFGIDFCVRSDSGKTSFGYFALDSMWKMTLARWAWATGSV